MSFTTRTAWRYLVAQLRRAPLGRWAVRHPGATDCVAGWVAATDVQAVYLIMTFAAQIAAALGVPDLVPGTAAKVGFMVAIWVFVTTSQGALKPLAVTLLSAGGTGFALAATLIGRAPGIAALVLLGVVLSSPSTLLLSRLRQAGSRSKAATAGRVTAVWVAGAALYLPLFAVVVLRWGLVAAFALIAGLRLLAALVAWLLLPDEQPARRARPRLRDSLALAVTDPLTRLLAVLSLASSVALTFVEVHLVLEIQRRGGSLLATALVLGATIAFGALFAPVTARVAARGVLGAYLVAFALQGLGCLAALLGSRVAGPTFVAAGVVALAGAQAGSTVVSTLRSTIPEWRADALTPARAAAAALAGYAGGLLAPAGGLLWALGGLAGLMAAGLVVCATAGAVALWSRTLRGLEPRADGDGTDR